ncbi:TPA: hypothetical protein ACGRP1_003802, partial [Stenotrophomonas maltophilia]
PSTVSGDLSVLVRSVGVDLGRHSRSTPCVDALRSIVEIFELELELDGDSSTHGVDPSDRGNLSEVGRHGQAGPLAAWMPPSSPHGWVYGVSCLPMPPHHPSECQLLLLLRPWLRQVQGAALPKNTHKKNSRPRPAVSV